MEKYDSEKFKLAVKRLSDAMLTTTEAANEFVKASKRLSETMPTAEQVSKRFDCKQKTRIKNGEDNIE